MEVYIMRKLYKSKWIVGPCLAICFGALLWGCSKKTEEASVEPTVSITIKTSKI